MRSDGDHIIKLREYLDQSGVLVNGTEDEIKAAKRAYRKIYKTKHKRKQRQENPEFTVTLSKQKGEHGKITTAARRHKMSVQSFLKMATLAYLNKSFLVPDRDFVVKLAQLLSDCLNEVQSIAQMKTNYHWQIEEKYDTIEKRIVTLETDMRKLFLFPIPIEKAVRDAVLKDSNLRLSLLNVLIHDRKD